ncbi:hypothetical protein NEOKW01_0719 [Nematocida sp. AWRm80]|nr:hypothetical protein NEOKW01_0719 [Nematocida sp. AWRm80]
MQAQGKNEYLKTIKESIVYLIEAVGEKYSADVFIKGYNAVYRYCTDSTEERFSIEGSAIYLLYDKILSRYLEKFPIDYSLESFVKFINHYRRSNEKVFKMLSFLSRYFIRVNIEVSNTNIVELKRLYFDRIFEVLFKEQEQKVYTLYIREICKYAKEKKELEGVPEKKEYLARRLKILRVFMSEYILMIEAIEQDRPLKRLFSRIASAIVNTKKTCSTEIELSLYDKIKVLDSLFKQKDPSKGHIYSMIEQKLDGTVMKSFIDSSTNWMFSTGITPQVYLELCPFYSFIDHSVISRSLFINAVFLLVLKVFKKENNCQALIKFLVFINHHLGCMPKTMKKAKGILEMLFIRAIQIAHSKNKDAFEKDLLQYINETIRNNKLPLEEVSLFVANIPGNRTEFWRVFLQEIKTRLIILECPQLEKDLITSITTRIESFKEPQIKRVPKVYRKITNYINKPTLYDRMQFYDPFGFEEILLCIRDVSISDMHFKKEDTSMESNCILLTYNRWNYPSLPVILPCEIEPIWRTVIEYCIEKGRKFTLNICPEVSQMTITVNNREIQCDLVHGIIIILLGKLGPSTLETITNQVLEQVTEEYSQIVLEKVSDLLNNQIIECSNGIYHISTVTSNTSVNLFKPPSLDSQLVTRENARTLSKSAIEALIVRIVKTSTGIPATELFSQVKEVFPINDQEISQCLECLQEKSLISLTDNILYYIP